MNSDDSNFPAYLENYTQRLNIYLVTAILDYFTCQELYILAEVFPEASRYLLKTRLIKGNCQCYWCCLDYWNWLYEFNAPRLNQTYLHLIKPCAKMAKIGYIRDLHYRLRSPHVISTNYLNLGR